MVGGQVDVLVANCGHMTPAEAFESVFAFQNERYVTQQGFTVTASMFVWRSVFEAVGEFVNGVPEDREWCMRARKMGFRIGFAPKSVVGHPARRTMPELKKKWRRLTLEWLEDARRRGKSPVSILLRQWAILLSIFPHSATVMSSRSLSGIGNRLRAIRALAEIRTFRFILVHRIVFGLEDKSTSK